MQGGGQPRPWAQAGRALRPPPEPPARGGCSPGRPGCPFHALAFPEPPVRRPVHALHPAVPGAGRDAPTATRPPPHGPQPTPPDPLSGCTGLVGPPALLPPGADTAPALCGASCGLGRRLSDPRPLPQRGRSPPWTPALRREPLTAPGSGDHFAGRGPFCKPPVTPPARFPPGFLPFLREEFLVFQGGVVKPSATPVGQLIWATLPQSPSWSPASGRVAAVPRPALQTRRPRLGDPGRCPGALARCWLCPASAELGHTADPTGRATVLTDASVC